MDSTDTPGSDGSGGSSSSHHLPIGTLVPFSLGLGVGPNAARGRDVALQSIHSELVLGREVKINEQDTETTPQAAVSGFTTLDEAGVVAMLDPDLLILDEPSAGLAPKLIDDVFERIAAINDAGTPILMIEQNARLALRESDRDVVIDRGETHIEGTGQDLLDSEEVTELSLGAT